MLMPTPVCYVLKLEYVNNCFTVGNNTCTFTYLNFEYLN